MSDERRRISLVAPRWPVTISSWIADMSYEIVAQEPQPEPNLANATQPGQTYNRRMSSSSPSRMSLPSWAVSATDGPLEADRKRDLYRALLFPRLVEEKMLILLRQG